jgi:ADP-heptose:LPS heptosyltransferase
MDKNNPLKAFMPKTFDLTDTFSDQKNKNFKKSKVQQEEHQHSILHTGSNTQRRIVLRNHQSPGDIVALTGAVRDLHRNCPGQFKTNLITTAQELWSYNPYVTLFPIDKSVEQIQVEYPLVHKSDNGPYHFIDGFCSFLEQRLGVNIRDRLCFGDIYVTDEEKGWLNQVQVITGKDVPFWIVVNGGKLDFTAKWWNPIRMQSVVDALPNIIFAQVGEAGHHHTPLRGQNIVNLIGKTDTRQLIRLMYHAAGVIWNGEKLAHV